MCTIKLLRAYGDHMESGELKYPKLIVLIVSVIGCFLGMLLIFPFCAFLGIDINQSINGVDQFMMLLVPWIVFTVFGYYTSCYLAKHY